MRRISFSVIGPVIGTKRIFQTHLIRTHNVTDLRQIGRLHFVFVLNVCAITLCVCVCVCHPVESTIIIVHAGYAVNRMENRIPEYRREIQRERDQYNRHTHICGDYFKKKKDDPPITTEFCRR